MLDTEDEFSRTLSIVLDNLGYSYEHIQYRRYLASSHQLNEENKYLRFFTCGSFAEGIVPLDKYDDRCLDVFGVTKTIICADESFEFKDLSDITLLQIDRGLDVSPGGHAMLQLVTLDSGFLRNRLAKSAQWSQHQLVLSSQVFLRSAEERYGQPLEIVRSRRFELVDRVHTFQGFLPSVLNRWQLRPRGDWPSKADIQRVSATEAMLVPSDSQTSPNKDVEWRISFTKAENILMISLRPVHLKVYVLLRMLFKKGCGITSYHLKTAMFWLAETTPSPLLHDGFLFAHLIRVLRFLRLCLYNWHLPHYFNTSWNVLAASKMCYRQQLIDYIDKLLSQRKNMLFGIKDISDRLVVLHRQLQMKNISDRLVRQRKQMQIEEEKKKKKRDCIDDLLEEWFSSQRKGK